MHARVRESGTEMELQIHGEVATKIWSLRASEAKHDRHRLAELACIKNGDRVAVNFHGICRRII